MASLRLLTVYTLMALGISPRAARADLLDDVNQLQARLVPHYRVVRLKPQLLERGKLVSLVPPGAVNSLTGGKCATVITLSTVETRFTVQLMPQGAGAGGSGVRLGAGSVGGLHYVSRCGTRKLGLVRMGLTMVSERAVVERLIVRSEFPLPPAYRYLPQRDPGPPTPLKSEAPPADFAPPLPVSRRMATAEQSYDLDGATSIEELNLEPPLVGTSVSIAFEPGCYRLRVFAPAARAPERWKAELWWPKGDAPPALDTSQTEDVDFHACVARRTLGELRFHGVGHSEPIVALRARWALPGRMRAHWGAEGAAALALALHQSQARTPQLDPVYDTLGTGRTTSLNLEVLPGECYVAAVAPLKGPLVPIILAAEVGPSHYQSASARPGVGTALAFRAGQRSRALLEVHVPTGALVWLLALWQCPSDSRSTREG